MGFPYWSWRSEAFDLDGASMLPWLGYARSEAGPTAVFWNGWEKPVAVSGILSSLLRESFFSRVVYSATLGNVGSASMPAGISGTMGWVSSLSAGKDSC